MRGQNGKFWVLLLLLVTPVMEVLSAPPTVFQSSAARRRAAEAAKKAADTALADRAVAEEARQRLVQAAASARRDQEMAVEEVLAAELLTARGEAVAQAGPPVVSIEEQARLEQQEEQMQRAMSNLSDEARQRMSQSPADGVPPMPLMQVAQVSGQTAGVEPAVEAPPSAPAGPQPRQLKPAPLRDPAMTKDRVVIYSQAAFFDGNKSIGVFTGEVRVYHPAFYLECDDLEVFMKQTSPEEAKPQPKPEAAEGEGEAAAESEIDKVIARGAMVTVMKYTEEGDVQVGKCRELTYDGTTELVTLRKWPQVQRGVQLVIATEEGTVMTLSQTGQFNSKGPNKTEILQGEDARKKLKELPKPPTAEEEEAR